MPRKRFAFRETCILVCMFLLVLSCSRLGGLLPGLQAASENTIIYVDSDATGANNGQSWRHAYTDLQSALAAAQPEQMIWIAQGIYRPTADLANLEKARTISFAIPKGVEIYGGFVGTEIKLDQRDWKRYQTILSGDLEANDLQVGGVITTARGIVGSNTRNLVTISNADQSTVLDGLIITAGHTLASDTEPFQHGAGIRIQNASPTLRNLSFFGNSAAYSGGAIANRDNSSPSISNSSFFGNSGYNGGAISNSQSSPSLSQVSFVGNWAVNGGAIYNEIQSSLTISSSTFMDNLATTFGGAIYNRNSSPTIIDSRFASNNAEHSGGAMYNLESKPTITDSKFSDNSASQGAEIYSYSSSSPITNTSFFDNRTLESAGAALNHTSARRFKAPPTINKE